MREFKELLPKSIKILSTYDFNLKSPKENGKTFKENSLIKSRYFSKKTDLICIAYDSGLEIDVLKKKPGIYSARWAGKNSDFNLAIKKVFRELNKVDNNWRKKKIKARFICALSLSYHQKKLHVFKEKLRDIYPQRQRGRMVLVMIQYSSHYIKEKLLVK